METELTAIVSEQLVDNPDKPWLAIPGATTEQELDWLCSMAHDKKLVYEIGAFLGRSTVAMLESGSPIHVVDDFYGMREEYQTNEFRQSIYNQFLNNTKGYSNLRIHKMKHEDFVPDMKCDMVFIDGSHHYDHVMRDILKFQYHKGILICGHDFYWWNSVREAVLKLFGRKFNLVGPNLWYVKQ